MEILETSSTKIAYELSGNQEGPKLVLIHGLYVNSDCWKPQLPFFENEYHILRFDLHGHGRSIKPGTNFSIHDYVQDMTILLNHLGWTNLYIVGHSLGGMVAMVYALEYPSAVNRLVIASSYCFVTDDEVAEVVDSLQRNPLDRFSLGIGKQGLSPYNEEDAKWLAGMLLDYLNQEDAILASYASAGFNICDELNRLDIPTLIIVGERDFTTPISAAEMLRQRMPRSQLIIIEGANHLVTIDHSKEFNETVGDFLTSHISHD